MKLEKGIWRYALLLVAGVAMAGFGRLQTVTFHSESRIWIQGTSNVRSFSCEAVGLQGRVQAESEGRELNLAQIPEQARSGDVSVPVQGLDCRNGTMNSHLRKALKAEANPTVRFELSRVAPSGNGRVRLDGTLEIAGQERPINVEAEVLAEPGGGVRVRGSRQILMTEYGVTPPSLMMGTMKVRDPVTFNFDVVLKP